MKFEEANTKADFNQYFWQTDVDNYYRIKKFLDRNVSEKLKEVIRLRMKTIEERYPNHKFD